MTNWKEQFEDWGIIKAMKGASDFNEQQYKLQTKLTFDFFQSQLTQLFDRLEGEIRSEDNMWYTDEGWKIVNDTLKVIKDRIKSIRKEYE